MQIAQDISSSVQAKKRRRSGLRRGFLACAVGEIDKPRCVSYFPTDPYEDEEEQLEECKEYTVEELFCCAYAPYFWQAIQIRYPEYAVYNRKLYAMFGGED